MSTTTGTYPLRFVPVAKTSPTLAADKVGTKSKTARVAGKWTLDKKFNGHSDTTPEGVIYVVTGAGGQHLYNPEQQDDPGFVAGVHLQTRFQGSFPDRRRHRRQH